MKDKNKILLFSFSFVLLLVLFTINVVSYFFLNSNTDSYIIAFFVKYHLLFMFLVTILATIFGFVSYLFMAKEINSSSQEKKHFFEELLELLDPEQKKIISLLIDNNGIMTQYEIVKIVGKNKIIIHRILDKLEKKKIIEKQKIGKINKIYLNKKYLL